MTMTTPSPTRPDLHRRLQALRQRVRTYFALYGAGVVIAALLAGILALVTGDYIFHFKPAIRVMLLCGGVLALAVLAWRHLVQPLTAHLTDRFLASRVEGTHPELADELMSAVHFSETHADEHNALAARALEAIERRASSVKFDTALDFALPRRVLMAVAGLLALLIALAAFNPELTGIALRRWLHPLTVTPWPQMVHVQLEWPGGKPPAVHPLGDPLTVRARVGKGNYDGLRVWLTTWSDTQSANQELMTPQAAQATQPSDAGGGQYMKVVDVAGQKMFYVRVSAGDDREQPAIAIRLAPRPIISQLIAHVTPPSYVRATGSAAERLYDLQTQAARAVEGSVVRLAVKTTKPLADDANGTPAISARQSSSDAPLALPGLKVVRTGQDSADVIFPARRSLDFRLVVRDTDGFENRVGGMVRLEVVADALPNVVITDPRHQLEVLPDAEIPVTVQATDDLGLSELYLRADNFDAKPEDAPRFRDKLTLQAAPADAAVAGVSGRASYLWKLVDLKMKPGERLNYYAQVRDNYAVPQADFPGTIAVPFELVDSTVRHHLVRSGALTLLISTKDKIEENYRHDLTDVRDQIRALADQQDLAAQQTKAIQKAAADSGVTTPQQRQQLGELASRQANQAARALNIAGRVQQIESAMAVNRMSGSDLGKLAHDVDTGMQQVGTDNMPKAASDLSRAQDAAGRDDQSKAEQEKNAQAAAQASNAANQNQEQALATMRDLIDRLGAAGDFEAERQKLADLIKQQSDLEGRLRDLAPRTLGKDPSSLSDKDKADLAQLARDQQAAADDTNNLTQRMEHSSQQLEHTDPASSDSLKAAVNESRNSNVSGSQSSAGQSAQANQMSAAAGAMSSARQGLERMMQELDKQNRRQLEQLSRQIEELLAALKNIRADEAALQDDTTKAGASAAAGALRPLGDRQGRLQGNTLAEGKRAQTLKDGRAVAGLVSDAANSMGTAAAALYKATQPPALPPEQAAIASLDKAIKILEDQKKKLDQQLHQQDLAQIEKEYTAIRDAQEKVRTTVESVEKIRAARGILMRPQQQQLGAQETEQGKLVDRINAMSNNEDLKSFDVILWLNSQITDLMTDAKGRLHKAESGKPVTDAQADAVTLLDQIIDALKQEQKKNNNNNFQSPGGGGGGGGGKPPLIPPVAQLKLLKAQQQMLNRATTRANDELVKSGDDAARNALRQRVSELGQRQAKIKSLAEGIVKQMGGP